MRVNHFLLIGLLFTGAALFTACSKEVKIEKNLWKKGGEWNIDNYDYSSVTTNSTNGLTINVDNIGTMTFNKDGGGTYSMTFFGSTDTGSLSYSNTETQLNLAMDGGNPVTYEMDWEKDKIVITNVSTSTNNGATTTQKEIYTLSKN
jgi:hypothetical protein